MIPWLNLKYSLKKYILFISNFIYFFKNHKSYPYIKENDFSDIKNFLKIKEKSKKENILINSIINASILIRFLFFMISFQNSFSKYILKRNNISESEEIIIKINKSGNHQVLSSKYSNCPNEIYINNQSYTFSNSNCKTVTLTESINIIKLVWTKKVSTCDYMFFGCSTIDEIDLSNFDTSSVISMGVMFRICHNLRSLKLTNKFKVNNVNYMRSMFYNCSSLSSLDLSNFDTSKVTDMAYMFNGCISLTSLNITNFDTSNVQSMNFMFRYCEQLTTLNLLNFNTLQTTTMGDMFHGCLSLISLDLSSFDMTNVKNISSMFFNCKSLEYIKVIKGTEYSSLLSSSTLTNVPENIVFCLNDNFVKWKQLKESKLCSEIDCNNDNWRLHQKKRIFDTNKCIEDCNEDYPYEFENKCYEKCPYDEKLCINHNIKIESTIIKEIKEESTIIKEETEIETKEDLIIIKKEVSTIIKEETEIETKENSIVIIKEIIVLKNESIKNIFSGLMDGSQNDLIKNIIDNKKDIIIKEENEKVQISTLKSQKNNLNYSSIDLGPCEDKLRKIYHLDETEDLIVFKIEHYLPNINIPIIDFILLNQNASINLNLSYCSNDYIQYTIPIEINEDEEYIYDPNSSYYNDKCQINNNDKYDMTLYDKKLEYNNNNLSLCEADCIYKGYDSEKKSAKCDCLLKLILIF